MELDFVAYSPAASERQLTHEPCGHILTNFAAWSADGQWLVYDVRSDAAGTKFDGTRIERVQLSSRKIECLYESRNDAYCGVATCSPIDDEVIFILGPEQPTPDWRYAADHRRGVIVRGNQPGFATNLDARDLLPPFTPGALRGGSHVHVFSGDGQLVSFTYEDHVLARHDETLGTLKGNARGDRNQRNVGVAMRGKPVTVPKTHPRNHDGESFSVLVTRTVNTPTPGSNEISKAYEDAWVGMDGYMRADGSRQRHAIAFLGDVLGRDEQQFPELFIVDLPTDITAEGDGPLAGTTTTRPAPPRGCIQRRLTFTEGRKYPGLSGPRHWPRSSPDGSQIAFLMRDGVGIVQLWTISPNGGAPRQITQLPFDVTSAFTWHPDANHIAFIADGSIYVASVCTGEAEQLTPKCEVADAPRPESCIFSPDGNAIAYVRQVKSKGAVHSQVFVVSYDAMRSGTK